MNQTVVVSSKTFQEIVSKLDQLNKEVQAIKNKLFEGEPAYGSNEWWEWSDKRAQADIKAGRVVTFDSVGEAIKWLNS